MATTQQRTVPWAQRALGLFVIVWLNLVLQPCAMALGGEIEHDCPHCPPSHEQQHGGHTGHDSTSNPTPCAAGAADCGLFDDFNYDGRLSQLKLKDTLNDLPVAIVSSAEFAPAAQYTRAVSIRPTRSPPPSSPTPLNVLYCVYLD